MNNGGNPKPTDALSGELWEVKKERIRRSSVFGKSPGWDLRSVSKMLAYKLELLFFYMKKLSLKSIEVFW